MKKICFITQGVLPIPTVKGGAVETLVEYLIDENEEKQQYLFDVYTVEDEQAVSIETKYRNSSFVHVKPQSKRMNSLLFSVYRVLKNLFNVYIPYSLESWKMLKQLKKKGQDYDVVVYEAGPTTQIPLIAKIVGKEKLLVHLHWDGYWKQLNMKKVDPFFKLLIPVSDYIGKGWSAKSGRSNDDIKVLRNCCSVEKFLKHTDNEERMQLKEQLQIPQDNKVVIFIGRIVEDKGVKELIKAYENMQTEKVTLLIIGSANFGKETNSTYEKEVATLIESSKKQIVFTGFVLQNDLYKYYDLADVAVMPSQFQDPAPLVSIETQATGTPLIATRVGGIPEYVTAESAVLIEKNESQVEKLSIELDRLIVDESRKKEMSEAGVQNALKYSNKRYYDDFSKLITSFLEEQDGTSK